MSVDAEVDFGSAQRRKRSALSDGPATPVSAIPDSAVDGTQALLAQKERDHAWLFAFALLAAVVFVGGITLYITRPWDPNAYAIHSFEDADTSMEGYPGLRTHLSQDASIRDEEEALEAEVAGALDAFVSTMAARADEADLIDADLEAYFAGEATDAVDVARRARTLDETFALEVASIEGVRISAGATEDRRQSCLVLAGYLSKSLAVLDDAATTTSQGNDRMLSVAAGKNVLAAGVDGHSYEEWHDLYRNAAASIAP